MTTNRIFRPLVLVFALVALAAPVAAHASERTVSTPTRQVALQRSLLPALNRVRRAHGLRPLRASKQLAAAAAFHANSMARFGYFSHTSRDGTSFDNRIARFYSPRGFSSWMVGENLLWATPTPSADSAVKMWLASPEHRANILRPGWKSIGIAAVQMTQAPGVFGGSDVTVLVTDFGARS